MNTFINCSLDPPDFIESTHMADRDWIELVIHFFISALAGAFFATLIVQFQFSFGTSCFVAAIAILCGLTGAYLGDDFWHSKLNPLHWFLWWM